MPTKFATFAEALAALCRQHHVTIGPTRKGGAVGVWNVSEGEEPVSGLEDRTGAVPVVAASDPLPVYFLTALAAKEHPGYVAHTIGASQAQAIATERPGTRLVPIGPPKHVRGWAVIQP